MAYDSRSITLKEYRLLFLKTTRASPKCLWVPRICSGSHGLIWDEKFCRSPILAIAVVDTHGKFSCRFTTCKDEPFKEYVPQLPRPDPLTNPQAPAHLLSVTSWFFKTTPTYEHSTLQENQNGRKPRRPPFFSHNKPGCEETAEPWPIFFFHFSRRWKESEWIIIQNTSQLTQGRDSSFSEQFLVHIHCVYFTWVHDIEHASIFGMLSFLNSTVT